MLRYIHFFNATLRLHRHCCASWMWPLLLMMAVSLTALADHPKPQKPQPVTPLVSSALSLRQLQPVPLNPEKPHIDITPYAEYWIDDSKDTTLTALQARATAGVDMFKPSKADDAHKIDGKVLWIRFETKASDTSSRWLLELGSPLIDDARLYWRDTNGRWVSLSAGDAVPRVQWPVPTRLPSFVLQGGTTDFVQYYLRIENARFPASLPIHVFQDITYLQTHQSEQMLLGALTGLIVLMLIGSISIAYVRREQAFAAYSVYLLALGVFNLTNTGLTPLYLWNESPLLADRMNYVLAAITAALGPLLVRLIVQPVVRIRAINIVIAVHAMAMIVCASLELLLPSIGSYRLLNIGVLLSVVLVYALVIITWQRQEPISRWVALCFAPVALSALPLILRNFGAIPNSWLTQYSVPIATMIELPLLFYALLSRSNMRREGVARAAGLPTQDALTGLPNMRNFLQHLHGSITRSHRFRHHYGLLHVDLTNHAWFVKEHGREMADRALILTSTRLQQLVRDVDTICRMDETQFVILVEGACNPGQLTKLAARVSASAHAPTEVLPVGASLRLSICCALMPTEASLEAGDDAHAQLGWLIAAAEAMPKEQRKLVRSIGF
ncbi:diguanylate cyclase [Variovorax sp. PCZ-1]|uniref:diguanylate cyclase n=1 Tax=Variovorax sp. PCZ-1 TaxID=2835533 RepID=UPI001BD19A6D|nr:diguanylate cyclase [Variovorax sp. PCZ-1]MBS7808337.1 GGDEF domain-containing protein [Variovorax sp. PCZ-1]